MKIVIEGSPKEIAALVLELQERQDGTRKEDLGSIIDRQKEVMEICLTADPNAGKPLSVQSDRFFVIR